MTLQTSEPLAVNEDGTLRITGVLKDELGVAIPGASLATLTLTLYDLATDAIINSRNAMSILNVSTGTVDASGNFALVLLPADNPIVTPATAARNSRERHIALLKWTYGTGRGQWQELQIDVVQLNRVPVA